MKLFAPEIDNIIEYDQVLQEIQDTETRAKWLRKKANGIVSLPRPMKVKSTSF